MLFRSARRGAKGKEATNNVTNPNWITAGTKDKFTSSSLWRGKGTAYAGGGNQGKAPGFSKSRTSESEVTKRNGNPRVPQEKER